MSQRFYTWPRDCLQQLTGHSAILSRACLHSQLDLGTGSRRMLRIAALAQLLGLFKKAVVADSHQDQPSLLLSVGYIFNKYMLTNAAQRLDALVTYLPFTWTQPETHDGWKLLELLWCASLSFCPTLGSSGESGRHPSRLMCGRPVALTNTSTWLRFVSPDQVTIETTAPFNEVAHSLSKQRHVVTPAPASWCRWPWGLQIRSSLSRREMAVAASL